jgi:hypothetical protein
MMADRSVWTPENKDKAAKMWAEGLSASQIGTALNVTRMAVLGLANRNRDAFPLREPKKTNGRSSRAIRPVSTLAIRGARKRMVAKASSRVERTPATKAVPNFEPIWAAPPADGVRTDLGRYRLAGADPIPFAALDSRQCRFPLECFEVKSGPQTPCCGQQTEGLGGYCQAHIMILRGRAA